MDVLTVGSLFAGIGGFDLGLERTGGFKVVWQVENNPFCNRVLAKHWPDVTRYGDITTVDWATVESVDLVCGGFPCQPFSVAGKRQGFNDHRSLWPQMYAAIKEIRPAYVIAENVPGIIGPVFDQVLVDLESLSYQVGALSLPACAVNAPHRRQRIWILAYTEKQSESEPRGKRRRRLGDGGSANAHANTVSDGLERQQQEGPATRATVGIGDWWAVEPAVGRVAHGVPHRVDRLRGLGNAVVPQVVEYIGRHILATARGGREGGG